ncbi:MAG: HNH endonuclease signature motif containing protein [Pseudomonadales bacterium]
MATEVKKNCKEDECYGAHYARGWCKKHYSRWQKHGHIQLAKPPKEFCSLSECNNKHSAFGYCKLHHTRFMRHGDPNVVLVNKGPVTWEWMLSVSKENEETCCIEWQRGTSEGYGTVTYKDKQDRAHRVSYMLNVDRIPKGKFVLHHCDNPLCINPKHLFIGTQRDNVHDMILKGRHPIIKNIPSLGFVG